MGQGSAMPEPRRDPARVAKGEENVARLHPDLKAILACPRCKGELEFREEQDSIVCHGCALVYPIREGLPVMLIDEATPLPDSR